MVAGWGGQLGMPQDDVVFFGQGFARLQALVMKNALYTILRVCEFMKVPHVKWMSKRLPFD